ncbi:MAG: AraC family transcriptional regulator [Paludibacteraceae bacterium]|nr:AraC family transcriptional regulator [Paludibacteraceae bacterium]
MVRKIENIDQFNRFFNQPSYHPLVSVVNLADAHLSLFEPTDFGMYCVVLMDAEFGELTLRGANMTYQAGTVFTMKPGHVVSMQLDARTRPKGWMLAFKPELTVNTGLGRDFYMFNFFDYEVCDALTLYEGERHIMMNCFNTILSELRAPDDEFTGHMVRLGIGQLLSYCRRFYDRQFDTQKVRASELIRQFESILDAYLAEGSELPRRLGPPQVAWCSSQFHLSANYFGDVVKHELGITAKEFIRNKIIKKAILLLVEKGLPVNEVATQLGFNYPNHFTRFFRQATGKSPLAYKKSVEP